MSCYGRIRDGGFNGGYCLSTLCNPPREVEFKLSINKRRNKQVKIMTQLCHRKSVETFPDRRSPVAG
jgi:hypothetical protein